MDILLKKFFEPERWEYALEKGVGKDIRKCDLIQLSDPDVRVLMKRAIESGQYEIAPPHTALIPKDTPGEFRTVYVNEPMDRILLSIVNDLLFESMPEMVHPHCKSYLKGVGCGQVVMEASKVMKELAVGGQPIGFKSDLRKYFDRVPIELIDAAFDRVEDKWGRSSLIDVVRKYYHSDLYFDTDGNLQETYQSLKQGCSVASWLADVVLYPVDEAMSQFRWCRRYSDDVLCLDADPCRALDTLRTELGKLGIEVNEKKTEMLDGQHWFKFLGFSLRGGERSLSSTRIKTFQKEIEQRTIAVVKTKARAKAKVNAESVIKNVMRYLYRGDGQHSWATGVLRVINVKADIDQLNEFAMDCIRAAITGKTKVGGLGYQSEGKHGCIARGTGKNVTSNRIKTGDDIGGYMTLGCMKNVLMTRRAVYDTLVRAL